MKQLKSLAVFLLYLSIVFGLSEIAYWTCTSGECLNSSEMELPVPLEFYHDNNLSSMTAQLWHRITVHPFNLFALIIFVCAICHTFLAHKFTVLSKRLRDRNVRNHEEIVDSFGVELLGFLGEVEVVFAIWILPLMVGITYFYSWPETIDYLNELSYVEPLFVVVIMAIASTNPILELAEEGMKFFAKIGKGTVRAWWWTILTVGPLAGSLITEPGAMTISALLLGRHFYELKPRKQFAYATLGLLFTNISVGGVFTSFAAPPVLMVSSAWKWGTYHMFAHFGWKALIGMLIANFAYYMVFRQDFVDLEEKRKEIQASMSEKKRKEKTTPFGIIFVHAVFLAWTVIHAHYAVIFIGSFMLFLGFYQATLPYQKPLLLRPPILVGLFLTGLVVHGSLQAWWIEPLLGHASNELLLLLSIFLTSFNDNAEITFLATLIPSFDESMKYAVLAGAVTGGGLTVIANAPNPSGQAILGKYFDQGVSAVSLLAAAIFPATVLGLSFYLLQAL